MILHRNSVCNASLLCSAAVCTQCHHDQTKLPVQLVELDHQLYLMNTARLLLLDGLSCTAVRLRALPLPADGPPPQPRHSVRCAGQY